ILWDNLDDRPHAAPPRVVLVVDDGGCLGRPCLIGDFRFYARAVLPALPAGDYQVTISVVVVSCTDSLPPHPLPSLQVPFHVSSDDLTPPPPPPSAPCVLGGGMHRVHITVPQDPRGCDADLGPDGTASVGFMVRSNVALAGLQGSFAIDPPGLEI